MATDGTRYGTDKAPVSIEGTIRSAQPDPVEPARKPVSVAVPPLLTLARAETVSHRTGLHLFLGWLTGSLMVAAIFGSGALLLSDAGPGLAILFHLLVVVAARVWAAIGHAPLSALPLLLAGASYTALQVVLRPAPMELLRRLMLGAAFLLWGMVQLMPAGVLATDLGDLVIALYVLDLGLMVQAELQRV